MCTEQIATVCFGNINEIIYLCFGLSEMKKEKYFRCWIKLEILMQIKIQIEVENRLFWFKINRYGGGV